MLVCRAIGTLRRLGCCTLSNPSHIQEVRHCIDRRVGPLWDSFDAVQGARDMATKPRRSTRNKDQAGTDVDAASQVSSVLLYLGQPLPYMNINIAYSILDSTMGIRDVDTVVSIDCYALHRWPLKNRNGPSCQQYLLFGIQDPSPTTELDKPSGKEQSRALRGHRSREDLPADNTLEGTPANKRRRGTRATENGTAPIGHAGDSRDRLDRSCSFEQHSPASWPSAIC